MDRLLNYTKENPKIIQLTHERKKDPTSPKVGDIFNLTDLDKALEGEGHFQFDGPRQHLRVRGIFNLTGLDKALGWGAFSIWWA